MNRASAAAYTAHVNYSNYLALDSVVNRLEARGYNWDYPTVTGYVANQITTTRRVYVIKQGQYITASNNYYGTLSTRNGLVDEISGLQMQTSSLTDANNHLNTLLIQSRQQTSKTNPSGYTFDQLGIHTSSFNWFQSAGSGFVIGSGLQFNDLYSSSLDIKSNLGNLSGRSVFTANNEYLFPENWDVYPSKSTGRYNYSNPLNPDYNYFRVNPGNPNYKSSGLYLKVFDNQYFDDLGNVVGGKSPLAHPPITGISGNEIYKNAGRGFLVLGAALDVFEITTSQQLLISYAHLYCNTMQSISM